MVSYLLASVHSLRKRRANLPVTPFHYPLAYVIGKFDGRLSLPGIVVGSMLPDLEIPFMVLLFGMQPSNRVLYETDWNAWRLVLHSMLGAVTIGALLSILFTVLVYPRLTSAVFQVSKLKVEEKCRFSGGLAFSCLLGGVSHVLLDVTNHAYNPVLWPFLGLYETPSPIVPILGGVEMASLLIHTSMIVLFVGLFIGKREHFWEKLLIG